MIDKTEKADSEDEKWEGLWIKDRRWGWWYANDGAMKTKIITGIKIIPEMEVFKKSTKEKKNIAHSKYYTFTRWSKSGRRKRKRRTHAAGKQAENVQEQRGK